MLPTWTLPQDKNIGVQLMSLTLLLALTVQGRYVEHVIQQSLPIDVLQRNLQSSVKLEDDPEEQWCKRDTSSGSSKRKSKYFNPPKNIPNPKTKTKSKKIIKVEQNQRVEDAQLNLLWKKRGTEIIVATLPSQVKGRSLFIHHTDLRCLRPHLWLTGEIIQGLLHLSAFTYNVVDTIYLMDYYTAGVLLFGDRATTRRHTLPKVNFDNFDGILSFVHVNKNHWNMLYIHAKSGTVYQMDPSPASSELEDSTHAAQRLQEYLKIRKHQGKTDWVDVKWKGGVMPHPVQMDGCSCGVIVVEMARAVMEAFPEFPKMNFSTKRRAMEEARRDMALQVLESSGCSGMDVIMASPKNVTALNGTEVKISCIFQSCYKMDPSVFVMNWTFQETKNDTEKMLMKFDKKKGMVPLRLDHFGDRVKFVGDLEKNDMSITLSEVEVKDEGYYHCNIINHPDRNAGRNNITLLVVLELTTPEDTTNAVAIGASVGGALALLILSMVVVKCLRHHKKQELISEEKMEEEEKLEAEVVTEEGTKQGYSLPEDA